MNICSHWRLIGIMLTLGAPALATQETSQESGKVLVLSKHIEPERFTLDWVNTPHVVSREKIDGYLVDVLDTVDSDMHDSHTLVYYEIVGESEDAWQVRRVPGQRDNEVRMRLWQKQKEGQLSPGTLLSYSPNRSMVDGETLVFTRDVPTSRDLKSASYMVSRAVIHPKIVVDTYKDNTLGYYEIVQHDKEQGILKVRKFSDERDSEVRNLIHGQQKLGKLAKGSLVSAPMFNKLAEWRKLGLVQKKVGSGRH